MSSAKLLFTIGLPRSGKSTWATRWVSYVERTPLNMTPPLKPRAIVCADSIRRALTGCRFDSYAEPMVATLKKYNIISLLHRGHDVVVDGTHTTEASIRDILKISLDAEPVVFYTPATECLRRACETDQSDLEDVIRRMDEQMDDLLAAGIDVTINKIRRQLFYAPQPIIIE